MSERISGIITASVGGLYTVRVHADGGYEEISLRARGIFRHSNISPLVGDRVVIDMGDSEESRVIDKIEERKNSLIRPPLSNLDVVFVTMAAASPTKRTRLSRISRS